MTHPTVVFRADASLQIGSGHVMRCLTLADALRAQGMECRFVCREHRGNLIEQILSRGFAVGALAAPQSMFPDQLDRSDVSVEHAAWLGTTQDNDASETASLLGGSKVDWLVVDHYALDRAWELALRPHCRRLMVIDDLADRPHDCDLLLDQNLGRAAEDYGDLVGPRCVVLAGARYALVRPEFAELREYSVHRRQSPRLHRLLVSMGGVDQANATGKALEELRRCTLPKDCTLTVVMGPHAPWLAQVKAQAKAMYIPTKVLVDVNDMALLMAESDLAVGAAGSTSWERCVLGLPTLMVVLARNQEGIAVALEAANAVARVDLTSPSQLPRRLQDLAERPDLLLAMSASATQVTDGLGIHAVTQMLGKE